MSTGRLTSKTSRTRISVASTLYDLIAVSGMQLTVYNAYQSVVFQLLLYVATTVDATNAHSIELLVGCKRRQLTTTLFTTRRLHHPGSMIRNYNVPYNSNSSGHMHMLRDLDHIKKFVIWFIFSMSNNAWSNVCRAFDPHGAHTRNVLEL